MDRANFPAHNVPGGGCSPIVPVNYTDPRRCQQACDCDPRCREWTFVSSIPACCHKDCSCSTRLLPGGAAASTDSSSASCCPAPDSCPSPSNCVSGVKDPASYHPGARPRPPWGDIGGSILPAPGASLRQMTGIAWGGRQYAYADYIPFDAIHYPDSYNSTIHAYSSGGNCSDWVHHGPVLLQGCGSCWDAGGVATPSAAVVDGRILLSYSGRHHTLPPKGGAPHGTRGIGLATALHPLGPFLRRPAPLAMHDGFSDDPQLVVLPAAPTAAGRSMVWLYHRLSASAEVAGCGGTNRCVRLLTSEDGGEHFTAAAHNVCLRDQHGTCLQDTAEPLEAKLISSESRNGSGNATLNQVTNQRSIPTNFSKIRNKSSKRSWHAVFKSCDTCSPPRNAVCQR